MYFVTLPDWIKTSEYIIGLGLGGIGLLSIAGFIPPRWRYFDLAGHFRVYYLYLALALGALAVVLNFWVLSALALGVAMINGVVLLPWLIPSKKRFRNIKVTTPDQANGRISRLLLANVLRKNREFARLVELVDEIKPDLIALVEPDQEWFEGLEGLYQVYPYRHTALRKDNYGLGLLSKYPLRECGVKYLTDQGTPTIFGTIDQDGNPLTVFVTHPAPPKSQRELAFREAQLEQLVELSGDTSGNVILCGDFNCSPWTSSFRRMARQAGLRDSSHGFGLQPTWPADRGGKVIPWRPKVAIDHVLVSQNIDILQRWRGPKIGSDHWPVLVDFKIKEC
jgi:endonuclease/exonuclease/phosphatase (EEP) superfamily protein YafD